MQNGQQAMPMHAFSSQQQMHPMHQQHFQSMNPFQMHTQPSFPPESFQSQPPSFQQMDSTSSNSTSLEDITMDMGMSSAQTEMLFRPEAFQNPQSQAVQPLQHPLMEKYAPFPPLQSFHD